MNIRFWPLDVTYGIVGGSPEVRLWCIDSNGRRIVLCDRTFRPYFYVLPSRDSDPKAVAEDVGKFDPKRILGVEIVRRKYFGRPVDAIKVNCRIPADVPKLREELAKLRGVSEVLEADIRFYMRYMIDEGIYPCMWHEVEAEPADKPGEWKADGVYLVRGDPTILAEEHEVPELRILAFDIECYNPRGVPRPQSDPVIIISTVASSGGERLFVAEDNDDRKVMSDFVNFIRTFDPDVIVGYNSNGFDWRYLMDRCKAIGVDLNVGRQGGSIAPSVYGHVSVPGRANVDLYDVVEKMPEVKIRTLENVAEHFGVMRKSERILIEGGEIYRYWDDRGKRRMLLEYAMQDARSIYGLAERLLPFVMQLSGVVGLTPDQVGAASVGFRVEWHLMRQAYELGELIPGRIERPYSPYKGAVVLKPKPGLHEKVAVLDFSAMYPSIMMKMNISPDTYVESWEKAHDEEVNIAPEVGHRFLKVQPGFYKKVLDRLVRLRNEIRRKVRELDPSSSEYRLLDERQKALKIIANATYGYCGWIGARWYKREVAEATTAWGRELIRGTIDLARSMGLEVVYGDTDSIFAKYDQERLGDLMNAVRGELGFEIRIDKVYDVIFFTEAKKRYCGLLPDGTVDVVGLEAVRGDWAEIAKEVQEEVIRIILERGDPYEAVRYVHEVIRRLRMGDIELSKLIIWRGVAKGLDEYEVEVVHVAVARKLMEAGYPLEVGDKVGYIITRRPGRLIDKAEPYVFVKSHDEVDVDYYLRKQIIPSALRILQYFDVTEDMLLGGRKQVSLEDFFG